MGCSIGLSVHLGRWRRYCDRLFRSDVLRVHILSVPISHTYPVPCRTFGLLCPGFHAAVRSVPATSLKVLVGVQL